MLVMVEKGFRGGICHSINRYAKANNKYTKDYDKNEELSYLNPIQDGRRSKKTPLPSSFSHVTSTNVGFSAQKFLTFSFNPFATLV